MSVIKEKVVKVQNKAEPNRFFNYPYNALEELLVNAVFHKSYRDPEPVEIRIYVDSIQIINYPGPAKWINMEKFKEGKVRARKYRNRRIGEFLKEIDLSEKQSTGITKVINELNRNSSPLAEFETDDDRTYLITTLTTREGFETNVLASASISLYNFTDKELEILQIIKNNPSITQREIARLVKLSVGKINKYIKEFENKKIIKKSGTKRNLVLELLIDL